MSSSFRVSNRTEMTADGAIRVSRPESSERNAKVPSLYKAAYYFVASVVPFSVFLWIFYWCITTMIYYRHLSSFPGYEEYKTRIISLAFLAIVTGLGATIGFVCAVCAGVMFCMACCDKIAGVEAGDPPIDEGIELGNVVVETELVLERRVERTTGVMATVVEVPEEQEEDIGVRK